MFRKLEGLKDDHYKVKPQSVAQQRRSGSLLPQISKRVSEVQSVERQKPSELSKSVVHQQAS
jgi:hypothetical protein